MIIWRVLESFYCKIIIPILLSSFLLDVPLSVFLVTLICQNQSLTCSNCTNIVVCHNQYKKLRCHAAIIHKQVMISMYIIQYATLQKGNSNISVIFILINIKMLNEVVRSISQELQNNLFFSSSCIESSDESELSTCYHICQ